LEAPSFEREMGENGDDDPQKMKRIAAAAYDYDNDPRWVEYWENVLIPPNMTNQPNVKDHFKRKFYKRHIVSGFSSLHEILVFVTELS
jgi:transmembrane protein 33